MVLAPGSDQEGHWNSDTWTRWALVAFSAPLLWHTGTWYHTLLNLREQGIEHSAGMHHFLSNSSPMDQRWNLNFSSLTAMDINYKDISALNKKNRIHHAEENLPKQKVVHSAEWLQDLTPLWTCYSLCCNPLLPPRTRVGQVKSLQVLPGENNVWSAVRRRMYRDTVNSHIEYCPEKNTIIYGW